MHSEVGTGYPHIHCYFAFLEKFDRGARKNYLNRILYIIAVKNCGADEIRGSSSRSLGNP